MMFWETRASLRRVGCFWKRDEKASFASVGHSWAASGEKGCTVGRQRLEPTVAAWRLPQVQGAKLGQPSHQTPTSLKTLF